MKVPKEIRDYYARAFSPQSITQVLLLAVLIWLAACDKVVQSTLIETREESGKLSCRTPGFCTHMGYSMGKMRTQFGYHYSCPGSRPADFEVRTYRVVLESGKVAIQSSRSTLRTTGSCS